MDKSGNSKTPSLEPRALSHIGLFGGTFDPIHNGHLEMARYARDRFSLDQVHFIVANKSPFKIDSTVLPAQERFTLVQKAIEKEKNFFACDFEIQQKDISYSYKTVEYFQKRFPEAKLYWIMGYDAYLGLPSWVRYEYLKNNLEFIVFCRNNIIDPKIFDDTLSHNFIQDFDNPISSTLVRTTINELFNKNKTQTLDNLLPSSIADLALRFYSKSI